MENPAPKDASMASVQGSTGVDQDRGMCEEKRTDDRPAEGGTLNSGRLDVPRPLERSTFSGPTTSNPKKESPKDIRNQTRP